MMKQSSLFFLLSLVAIKSFAYGNIQAFGISTEPFSNSATVQTCYVDIAQKTLSDISARINQSPLLVDNLTPEHFQSHFMREAKAIGKSIACQQNAIRLGVTKLPAIVFDGEYVIYGQMDIELAKSFYENKKAGRL